MSEELKLCPFCGAKIPEKHKDTCWIAMSNCKDVSVYAKNKAWNTRTEPKEQDVCPECGGTGQKFNDFGLPDKDCPSCTGKAPVDKIREAFHKWVSEDELSKDETDFSDSIRFKNDIDRMMACGFYAGYKSQQAEIERLTLDKDRYYNDRAVLQQQTLEQSKELERLKAENEAQWDKMIDLLQLEVGFPNGLYQKLLRIKENN